jgi:hypothetical protein
MVQEIQENLFDFWRRCPLSGDLYYHPDDWPCLMSRNGRYVDAQPRDFREFLESSRFGDFKDTRFHLSLLPVPFPGNLAHAEIIILLLNPGFDLGEYWAETYSKPFRVRLEANLRQDFEGIRFPFLGLDPEFSWHSAFSWWERKFRDILTSIARHKFNGCYAHALRDLAKRVAAVELVPYHSQRFSAGPLVTKLPSAKMAKRYVQEVLVPKAEAGEKLIIATRRCADWGVNELHYGNVIVYRGGHTRGASLSSKSDGGRAILRRYGITTPAFGGPDRRADGQHC